MASIVISMNKLNIIRLFKKGIFFFGVIYNLGSHMTTRFWQTIWPKGLLLDYLIETLRTN